jgi:3'-phosphoadenosine 5'-phosphosulfate sulfotransferase (PAPS reductase)/FAD synthetase
MPKYILWRHKDQYIAIQESDQGMYAKLLSDPRHWTRVFDYFVSQEEYATLVTATSTATTTKLPRPDQTVIASISGGKDSAAMGLYLLEKEIPHIRVFMDTGWEHQLTYEYLDNILEPKLGPITRIRSADFNGFPDLCLRHGMFPSRLRRSCTEELKMKPFVAFVERYRTLNPSVDIVNAVGIRRGESIKRSTLEEWDFSERLDSEVWRPLIDWDEQRVYDIHKKHGLPPNPLYLKGASRVGCWPCINARKKEISLLESDRVALIRNLEMRVADVQRQMFWREQTTSNPTLFQAPIRLSNGARPCMPIDEIVQWARTPLRYEEFFEEEPSCVRWGVCE